MTAKLAAVGLAMAITVVGACAQDAQSGSVPKGENWSVQATESGYVSPFPQEDYSYPVSSRYYTFGSFSSEKTGYYGVLLRAECIEGLPTWGNASPSDPKGAAWWTKVKCGDSACKNVMVYVKDQQKGWVHQIMSGNVLNVMMPPAPKGEIQEYVVSFEPSDEQNAKLDTGTLTISISDFLDVPSFTVTLPCKTK